MTTPSALGNSARLATWLAVAVIAIAAAPPAGASALGRDDEAVVFDASGIPPLLGIPPSRLVAFRYASVWTAIPVQVDERAVVDFGTIYNSTPMSETVLAYADPGTFTGADSDPTLDDNDEVALRAVDAGGRAPQVAAPPGTVPGSGVELTITNPLNGAQAWAYLFESDGSLDPAAGVPPIAYSFHLASGDYKTTYNTSSGPNPENSTVVTAAYAVHFADRWIRDETSVSRGGATGIDLLDRHKVLFGPGDCQRSEKTFSAGEGAFIVNRAGPVRALRGYVGANSGVTTYRVHAFYAAAEEIFTALRVHPIPGIMDYFDYSPEAAGMIYRDNLNPSGVTIDGVPDAVTTGALTWEMVTGLQGTLVSTFLFHTDIPDFATTSYYSDTTAPTVTQCTGDAFEYGASGFWRNAGIPNSDPSLAPAAIFELTRVIRYASPNQPLAFAQARAAEAQAPMTVSAAPLGACPDADGDGYAVCSANCSLPAGKTCGDCDDTKASVHPGATEICNGIDDNCNGSIDEGLQATFYRDADGDGFGNLAVTTLACSAPAGYVANSTDCDDTRSAVHPGATEVCGNGLDDDCNGLTDNADPVCVLPACPDGDGDGYAVCSASCSLPAGKTCGDCDDTKASVHPGATEVCNGIDDNCNGSIDEGVQTTFYRDADGDGFGNLAVTVLACTVPAGYVANATDCDDTRASVHPGATEACNGLDDNCNGSIDEGVQSTFYRDADGDGFGNVAVTVLACTVPAGYVANATDCDDTRASVHPGATEVCNGLDDNCNGTIDEGVRTTFYRDADGDGFGNLAVTTLACSAPAGYVANSTDCDDTRSAVHPGATEVCGNGFDDDCNGLTDNADPSCALPACPDGDGDGFVVCSGTCSLALGMSCGECDDTNASVHPGASEVCNGLDDNCDGSIDEGVQTTFYRDADGDGFGNSAVTALGCTVPAGYVSNSNDCDDTRASVHPGAVEVCGNGLDDDCGGTVDVSFCESFDTGGDGRVDGLDLGVLGRAFGSCGANPASAADYNHDGCVDGADLAFLAAAWACHAGEDLCHP